MRSRVSVTGSAAAGPSLRARRHNLNEPRKQSFPCVLRPPQGPLPAGAECPARDRNGRHRARDVESVRFDRLDEPTGESTSELLHCHDLDATRFPSRGFHARHASLVCTTTVRPAVMAISSTKDQADPNQLHSFVT